MTLKRYGMQDCKLGHTHVAKKTSLVSISVLRMILRKKMQKIPYASAKRIQMYAQVCMRLNIAYVTEMLSRYLDNSRVDHRKAAKGSYNTYRGQKTTCLHIKGQVSLRS